MAFNSLLSYWQEQGLDPMTLGQPQLWITSHTNEYLRNTSNNLPINGQTLLSYLNYSNSGFTFTRANTTNNTTYSLSTSTGLGYISSVSSPTSNSGGQYQGGTTSSFANLHKGKFTIYWAWRNSSNEDISTNKFMLATAVSSNSVGAFFGVGNASDGVGRGPISVIYKGITSENVIAYSPTTAGYTSSLSNYNKTDSNKNRIWSWRVDLTVNTGDTAMWFYHN